MIGKLFISLALGIYLFFSFNIGVDAATVSDIIGIDKPKYLVQPDVGDGTAVSLILSLVGRAVDILLFFAGIFATILIIIGGFRYVTYFGVEDAKKQAKNLIVNALIGLVIIICSALIVQNAERLIKMLLE